MIGGGVPACCLGCAIVGWESEACCPDRAMVGGGLAACCRECAAVGGGLEACCADCAITDDDPTRGAAGCPYIPSPRHSCVSIVSMSMRVLIRSTLFFATTSSLSFCLSIRPIVDSTP